MITKSKVIELFCMTYDFCKFFILGQRRLKKSNAPRTLYLNKGAWRITQNLILFC